MPQAPAQVRLNGGYRGAVCLQTANGIVVRAALVGGQTPLEIAASAAVVVADNATFDLRCKAAESNLTVIEGTADIRFGDLRQTISAGQIAPIVAGRVSQQQRVLDTLLAKQLDPPVAGRRPA